MIPDVPVRDEKCVAWGKTGICKVVSPQRNKEVNFMCVVVKGGISSWPLLSRQHVGEMEVKGTHNEAVLHENAFAVPWRTALFGRQGAIDVGAIDSTQGGIKEWWELGRWLYVVRTQEGVKWHQEAWQMLCRRGASQASVEWIGNILDAGRKIICSKKNDTHFEIVVGDHWKHSPTWAEDSPVTTV